MSIAWRVRAQLVKRHEDSLWRQTVNLEQGPNGTARFLEPAGTLHGLGKAERPERPLVHQVPRARVARRSHPFRGAPTPSCAYLRPSRAAALSEPPMRWLGVNGSALSCGDDWRNKLPLVETCRDREEVRHARRVIAKVPCTAAGFSFACSRNCSNTGRAACPVLRGS